MPVTSRWHPSFGTSVSATPAADEARPHRASRAAWALSAVGLIVVGVLAWWVTNSAVFEARRIVVTGNRQLTAARVLRIGGVSGRTNVVWFSPGRVERRLTRSPWILAARVSRTLPATISISVTERAPIAVLEAGRSYLIAADGTVLGPARGAAGLPTIRITGSAIVAGARATAALEPLKAIAGLPASLRDQVRGAYVEHGLLTVELRGGIRAVYGDAGAAVAKGEALAAVLRWAGRAGMALAYVDVRAPASPAAGPATGDSVLDPAAPNGPIALHPTGSPKPATR